ncbi:MAG: hypothetical protein CMH22_05545 [Methylophaga sp.]|nr:hypothetical protein [Methylophaga sp.]|tara:strand:- start:116462 stop:116857 length:396 start_codon:yes stop_codon:yes gene_type:complete
MNKISFDYDSTLDKQYIQDFARSLIIKGFDVWVCTSRWDDETAAEKGHKDWNKDLFKVTDSLGIPREKIIFTNYELKSKFLKDKGFILHLDDDWVELNHINNETNIVGISVFGGNSWKNKVKKILSTLDIK